MDKAAIRERAMSASTRQWRFFMDSDDRLSEAAVEEIRSIVSDVSPKHFIWRMPTRIFIDGREILHEATYPSYQTRLVHIDVCARFKNPVHDHLAWDEKRFPAGTMQNFYDFHWSRGRVDDYWAYLSGYAKRELQTFRRLTFFSLVYQLYRRLRTIAGYVFWRLPSMYSKWGFKDSMPLWIEFTIVRYHIVLFFGMIGIYIRSRFWAVVLVETLRRKDLNRILSNLAVRRFEAYGRVLDVGGGHGASHWRYLETRRWFRKIVLDIDPAVAPDLLLDLEKEELPYNDGHFDTVLLFNVLEHLRNRAKVLAQIRRTLKPGSTLIGVVPFLVGVHADPHDYVRCTNEELNALLREAGFQSVEIEAVGRGPFTASYYQSEFLFPSILKLVAIPAVLGLDGLLLMLRPAWREKFPLSYVFTAR